VDRAPARLRSLFAPGLSGLLEDIRERVALLGKDVEKLRTESAAERRSIDERLTRIEENFDTLRSLIRGRDDRAQQKLKAGLSSVVNLMAVLPELKIGGVIPPFPHQGFEITGEEAAFLTHLIRRHRPKLIMELGSGSSTFLFAAALRANGSGRLISIEHESEHAAHTAQMLAQADLSDWVELLVAPLAERGVDGRAFHWYDIGPRLAALNERIDLLFIDGPPGKMQSLSRYPALPVLRPHLASHALIFVDDAGREDETRMIELWRGLENIAFKSETLDFLPRAPVLLTMGHENPIAELHVARDERIEAAASGSFIQGRRSGVS
jgi:predicted O-methyltransferase YrrM